MTRTLEEPVTHSDVEEFLRYCEQIVGPGIIEMAELWTLFGDWLAQRK